MTTRRTSAGLHWWQWARGRARLVEWVRTLIGERPYTIEYRTGEGSYCDFGALRIVVEPNMPERFVPAARRVPTTWGTSRVLRPSSLEVLTARALAYHEAGHVLFTAVGSTSGDVHHWLTNALEDERMERLVVAFYPPAGRDIAALGHRLWQAGPGVGVDRTTLLLNACLFHRWDHARPTGAASLLALPDADGALWATEIRPRVEEAWMAAGTARVAALAREILHLVGVPEHAPAERLPGLMTGTGDRPVRGRRRPGDAPLGTDRVPSPDGAASAIGPGEDPDLGGPGAHLDDGRPDVDPSDGLLWMQPYHNLERAVAGDVRRLAPALAVKTERARAVPDEQRGRFAARAYARSRGATPLVRRAAAADTVRSLAVVTLVDGTTSMGGMPGGTAPDGGPSDPARFDDPHARMPHVRPALMLLQRGCAGAGIPHAIGLACQGFSAEHRRAYLHFPGAVAWLQRFDTSPQAEGPRALIAGLYPGSGQDAVSTALGTAQAALRARSEETRLILYIHDGEPTDEKPAAVAATVVRMRREGIVVLGLYLGPQQRVTRMEAIFGPEWVIATDDLARLPGLLARVLMRFRVVM